MSTQLRNSIFKEETVAFLRPLFPGNPLPFLYALVDGLRANGTDFIKTDHAKALLHTIMSQSHGQGYSVDGIKEHDRLESIFRK